MPLHNKPLYNTGMPNDRNSTGWSEMTGIEGQSHDDRLR